MSPRVLANFSLILAVLGAFICGMQSVRSKGRGRLLWTLGLLLLVCLNVAVQVLSEH